MSKIRNSLGMTVLPVPEHEMTWEEYKAKYGIDLASVLHYYHDSHYRLSRLKLNRLTKLLFFQDITGGWFDPPIRLVQEFDQHDIMTDDGPIGVLYMFPIKSYDESDGTFSVAGHVNVSVYDDTETPCKIVYQN